MLLDIAPKLTDHDSYHVLRSFLLNIGEHKMDKNILQADETFVDEVGIQWLPSECCATSRGQSRYET